MLTNGPGNIVASKCMVPSKSSVRFKIILSWYRQFRSADKGNEDYYYHNFYASSKDAAKFGMSHFDDIAAGVKGMVTRVMSTIFPEWYLDRLLNNTYPLVQNMQCAKDGRVAFWEGRYPIIGSIELQEHAQVFYSFN